MAGSPEERVSDEAGDVMLSVPEHRSDAVQHLGTHATADPARPRGGRRRGVLRPGQRWPQAVVVVVGGHGGLGWRGGDGMVEPGQQDRHALHAAAAHTQLIQQGDGRVQVGAS